MVEAIVSIEDYRFYEHGALDLRGTIRALVTNQATGGVVQGGSSITQQMVKLTLLDQAETKEEAAAAPTTPTPASCASCATRSPSSRTTPRTGSSSATSTSPTSVTAPTASSPRPGTTSTRTPRTSTSKQSATLAGLVKNPTGYDPTNYPERALDAPQRRARPDGRAQCHPAEQGREDQGQKLGLDVAGRRQRLRAVAGAVLLRLRRQLPASRTVARRDGQADRKRLLKSGGLTIRTTLDLDYQAAADDAVAGAVYPTDQAIGGLAMVEPRTGNVKALAQSRPMGGDKGPARPTSTTSSPRVRRRQRLPGRLDVQGVRAGRGDQAGHPAQQTFELAPQTMNIPDARTSRLRRPAYYGYGSWTSATRPVGRPYEHVHRHPAVGEHLLRPARGETGMCEPLELAKKMGIKLTPDAPEVPSVVHPRRLQHQPAGDGRGLRHVRRPRPALRRPPGDRDRGRRRADRSRSYPETASRCCPARSPTPSTTCSAASWSPAASAQNIARPCRRPARPAPTTTTWPVWFVGYTPRSATAAMIAGANKVGHWVTLNGQTVGGSYIVQRLRLRHRRPDLGRRDGSGRPRPCPTRTSTARHGDEIAGVLTAVPDVAGMRVEDAEAGHSRRPASTPTLGGYVNSEVPAGPVAYTSPGGRHLARQRRHRRDLPVHRLRPPPEPRSAKARRARARARSRRARGLEPRAGRALSRAGDVPRRRRRRRRRDP